MGRWIRDAHCHSLDYIGLQDTRKIGPKRRLLRQLTRGVQSGIIGHNAPFPSFHGAFSWFAALAQFRKNAEAEHAPVQ